MDETQPNHVELAINDRSDFILVQDLAAASGTPGDRPTLGVFTLTGGDNGLTDLADADFIGGPSQHTGYAFDEIDALNLLMVPGVTTVPVINAGITPTQVAGFIATPSPSSGAGKSGEKFVSLVGLSGNGCAR